MYSLAYREVLLSFISAVLKMGRWLDADRLASLFLPSGNKKGEVLPKISKILNSHNFRHYDLYFIKEFLLIPCRFLNHYAVFKYFAL